MSVNDNKENEKEQSESLDEWYDKCIAFIDNNGSKMIDKLWGTLDLNQNGYIETIDEIAEGIL